MKASDPSSNGNPETDLKSINIPSRNSELVRLGSRKENNNGRIRGIAGYDNNYRLALIRNLAQSFPV